MSFVRKETLHIVRDPRTMLVVLGIPVVQLLLFGFAISTEVNNVNVAVVAPHPTEAVRQCVARLEANPYFTFKGYVAGPEIDRTLRSGRADPVVVENRYNPTLEYRNYMIPALMIMLLILLCGFLPALNLVGEKETGTIEQINVTPVSQFAFTLAKLIPYWAIGLGVLTLAMSLAWAVYGLVPVGSLGAVYLAAALFIFVMSGFGVIAANYSATMQQTMFGMFFFVMIFILMSGLLTPVESMPAWAQRITWFLPPRYFIGIMRAVYLKGATVADLRTDYAALALFAVLFNLWAALSYRKRS